METVKWIKVYTDIFDNEKALLIDGMPKPDNILIIWIKLLVLAGKQNNSGVFDGLINNTTKFAAAFHRPKKQVENAFNAFKELEMIEENDGVISIKNWEKYQNIDGLEKIREHTNERQKRYRENKKVTQHNATDNITDNITDNATDNTNVTGCNSNITPLDIDIDIDKDIDIKEIKSIEKEKNQPISLQRFLDRFPNIKADGYTGEAGSINWDEMGDKVAESNYLQGITSLLFFCQQHKKILGNVYRDFDKVKKEAKNERANTNKSDLDYNFLDTPR
jgi:predicted phage replisome organizer